MKPKSKSQRVLEEWQRRVKAHPEKFASPEEVKAMSAEEYAERAAPYLEKLNAEIS